MGKMSKAIAKAKGSPHREWRADERLVPGTRLRIDIPDDWLESHASDLLRMDGELGTVISAMHDTVRVKLDDPSLWPADPVLFSKEWLAPFDEPEPEVSDEQIATVIKDAMAWAKEDW